MPQVPSSLINTTESRCKASGVKPETQWAVPAAHRRDAYRQLAIDGPDIDFSPEAHAPTKPLFTKEAEQLTRSLHQLLNINT